MQGTPHTQERLREERSPADRASDPTGQREEGSSRERMSHGKSAGKGSGAWRLGGSEQRARAARVAQGPEVWAGPSRPGT